MASHIVRPDAEEKAGLNAVAMQCRQQPGNTFTRSSQGININA
ncbi:hypothetical protein SEEGA711_09052 [Salmonella enterica subsp. enterica serovar Gaminara str. ATCC BAA-711]|nr:hypothetical protein SEEGA711_09052 [Salmonella enterica subsp. enterica serovar Gaminara str. ATCC BAA-711]